MNTGFYKLFISVILPLLLVATAANAQIIVTVAGNGTSGYSTDGVAATTTEIFRPTGIHVDGGANIYIADNNNNRIRKVNVAGFISTIAGTGVAGFFGDGGPATDAELQAPGDVYVDGSANVFIADVLNQRIRKITPSGIISTIAGNGAAGYGSDGVAATATMLNIPSDVTTDIAGNVYIADAGNNRIRKISASGIITTVAGNGTTGFSGDGAQATNAELNNPTGIAVDVSGNLFIADQDNHRIRFVDVAGVISTLAGSGTAGYSGDGGLATAAMLNRPTRVEVDLLQTIFIADRNNHRVRKVDFFSKIITTAIGDSFMGYTGDGMLATASSLNFAAGVCADGISNVYVADYDNHRIRRTVNCTPPVVKGISGVKELCRGATTVYTNTSTGGVWSSSNTAVATIVPSSGYTTSIAAGTTTISYSVTNTCSTLSATKLLTVDSIPLAGPITGDGIICAGDTVILSNSAIKGVWSSSNTVIATISPTGYLFGLAGGKDTIVYTITNSCGTDTAMFPVLIMWCGTGINANNHPTADHLIVSPNPNDGAFFANLVSPHTSEIKILVTDMTGRKIKELTTISNKDTEFAIRVPPGLYFISASSETGTLTEKIIITE